MGISFNLKRTSLTSDAVRRKLVLQLAKLLFQAWYSGIGYR